MEILKEYLNCNLCGQDHPKLLFETEDENKGKIYGIVKCSNCGLVYRNSMEPRGKNIDYYTKEYYPQEFSEGWGKSRISLYQGYFPYFEKYRKVNRILDVGAGHGFFLKAAKEKGFEPYGVELSNTAALFCKRKFGIELLEGDIMEAHFADNFFDIITFWNVLDHLDDPKEALRKALELLRPGGAIFIRSPNATFHVNAQKTGESIALFKKIKVEVPYVFHLYSFNKKTITKYLKSAGFTNIAVKNSSLVWTNFNDSGRGRFIKRLVASCFEFVSYLISCFTLGKLIVSPSFLASAEKPNIAPR